MPLECVQIPPGTILAGYRVESELGRGNNGVVYLAEQQSLGRQVAFKILLPELAAEPGYVESFLREARLAARLDHPYIVQAYDAGATPEGYYYFAMELVIGPSLEDVRRDSPELLTFELIFRLSIELAEALDYAWTVHKMTHGDIKPGNLLISEETGELKLTDLGLARVSGSNTGDDIMATPLYAAPEVIRGETADVGVRSDLYSFGIMLYELLCGSPPFVGSPQKVLEQHLFSLPRPLAERNPDLDPALVAFVEKLIDKNPANRPASWLEVRDFLATLLEGLQNRPPVTLRELEPPELRRKRHRRVFLFWFGGILLAAGLAAAVLLALRMMRFEPTPLELPPEPAATELPPQEEAEKERVPELAVRFSSPAAATPPESRPAAPIPESQTGSVPVPAAVAAPKPAPPAEASPAPEKNDIVRTAVSTAEPRIPRARRQRGFLSFDPPVSEPVLQQRSRHTVKLLSNFGNRLNDEWTREAEAVITESYRLMMQLETRGLLTKEIDRIDLLPSGQGGSSWVSNGPSGGVLRIAPDVPPLRIARELGRGIFEANRRRYDLPNGLRREFGDAFQYFVQQRLYGKAEAQPQNRVLRHCNHSLATFVLMFKDLKMLRQLRSRR